MSRIEQDNQLPDNMNSGGLSAAMPDLVASPDPDRESLYQVFGHLLNLVKQGGYYHDTSAGAAFEGRQWQVELKGPNEQSWNVTLYKIEYNSSQRNTIIREDTSISASEKSAGESSRNLSVEVIDWGDTPPPLGKGKTIETNFSRDMDTKYDPITAEDKRKIIEDLLATEVDVEATRKSFDEQSSWGNNVRWVRDGDPLQLGQELNPPGLL